jgi:hypothetical protein
MGTLWTPRRSRVGSEAVAVLVVLAALAARFRRLVFDGVFHLREEIADEFYPLATSVFSQIRAGDLPTWTPEILLGYPAAGSVDLHLFSPFNWPWLVLPPHAAVAVWFAGIQVVSGLLMYALGRGIGLSVTGATTAAVLWLAGCPADIQVIMSMALATIAWLPLVMLCWHRYCGRGDVRWSILAGGALGLALLGGHIQFVYWFTIFLAGYTLFILPPDARCSVGRLCGGALLAALVGFALAAVGILPTFELLTDSIRATLVGSERVLNEKLSLIGTLKALRYVVLCATGDDPSEVEYRSVGALPLALALTSIGRGRRFENRMLTLAALFLVLSLGAQFAPSNWLLKLLPLNHFRYPGRIALVFSFGTTLLAGRGMEALVAGGARRGPGVVLVPLLALACVPLLLPRMSLPSDALRFSEGVTSLAGLALICGALLVPDRRRRLALGIAAVCLVVVHAERDANPSDPPPESVEIFGGHAGTWTSRSSFIGRYPPRFLEGVPRWDRYGPTRVVYFDLPFEHNLSLLTGHHSAMGLVSLRPQRVDRVLYARNRASDTETSLYYVTRNPRLLDLMNVRYVVVPEHISPAQLQGPEQTSLAIRSRRKGAVVVENRSYLPRAHFVSRASVVRDGEEAYRMLMDPSGTDPRKEVVLEAEADLLPAAAPPGDSRFAPARIVRYESERVEVQIKAPSDGWLVLLDRDADGWSCEVNGRQEPIRRAHYLFRAVHVGAGTNRVVFLYRNALLWWGGLLTTLGIGVSLTALVALLRRKGA